LLYAFTKLEQIHEASARALLPLLIAHTAGRKDVKDALARAINDRTGNDLDPDDPEGDGADTTMDLFQETPPTADPKQAAIDALRAIRNIPAHFDTFKKWTTALDLAIDALAKIDRPPTTTH